MLFLQKPIFWAYEEEVRVAKCIADRDSEGVNLSGCFNLVEIEGRRLYCYQLPKGSIKEIYLGLRNSVLNSEKEFRAFAAHARSLYNQVETKACRCFLGSDLTIIFKYQDKLPKTACF
jgi:hypothetical protein